VLQTSHLAELNKSSLDTLHY